ncbi:cellulase family glycosylhydrolase [Leptothoe sp. ISB3NOV94-8A]|nr:cellulase family glycosylhydrolase [Leptothoe sp. LEGE 181152]
MASDTLYGVHLLFTDGPSHLNDNSSRAETFKNYIDEAIRLGSDVVRFPGDWHELEPVEGQWNNNYINDVRDAIQYAEDNGVQVVMLFAQTPEWARPNPNDDIWHPPADVNDFANAVAYFYNQLASVRDNITAWEIWNEPNVFEFWGSADPATDLRDVNGQTAYALIDTGFASDYAPLLNAAYTALHNAANAANTNVTVLGGSVAGTDFQYVQALLDAGAMFDGLAVHPYTRPNDSTGIPWAPDTTFAPTAQPTLDQLWSFQYGMEQLRNLVAQPLWITEFGWRIGNGWGDVSSELRVDYMETALELIQGWNDVEVAIAYRPFDDPASSGNTNRYGLLNDDGLIRPTGRVLQEYAGLTIHGTPSNDEQLFGAQGQDELFGHAGDDILWGFGGDDFYVGGAGNDQFVFTAGNDFVKDFEVGADTVVLSESLGISSFSEVQPLLQQWGNNAAIVIDANTSIVMENIDINHLSASSFHFDDPDLQVYGTPDNDLLLGALGQDALFGGAGDDILWGQEDNDFYVGNAGDDQFVITAGNDFVKDFELAADRLILLDLGVSTFSEVQPLLQQWGSNAAIVIDANTSVVLENVTTGDLTATHFGFLDPSLPV